MLPSQVSTTMRRHSMVRPGDRVLIGLSGGPDSVALTHVLFELRARLGLSLALAHLNHGLRPEADEDEGFCRALADHLGLPIATRRDDVAGDAKRHRRSLEEQGRLARYGFFAEQASTSGCTRIALGHTMDDQAETVLMRLARGTATRGLAAIRPVAGLRIRPLIEVRRADILDYLRERGLTYREDASNDDRRFTRNRVRHDVLPALSRALNPRIVEALAHHGTVAREDEDYLDAEARRGYARMSERRSDGVRLPVPELLTLHPAIRRRVLRLAFLEARGELRNLGRRHVEDVLALLAPGQSGKEAHLPGLVAERSFDELLIHAGSGRTPRPRRGNGYNGYEYHLAIPSRLAIPESEGLLTVDLVDRSRVEDALRGASGPSVDIAVGDGAELRVRSPKPSDRFRPLGSPGTKSLARYLMERKVAKNRRREVPLVVCRNDGSEEILWVAGHGISETARLRAGRRFLHLEWVSS